MHAQIKGIPFELKELSDDGDFTGIASVFGNIDEGNDVVDPGAFDASLKQNGNKVRLMDGHKVRIGVATVESTRTGLKAVGKINKNKQSGAEALSDLRFYRDNGMPMGMSIGYETLDADPPSTTKDGARHLKSVRLWEVTITEFPMNLKAQVTSVKSIQDLIASVKSGRRQRKDDFSSELQEILLYAAPYQMISALSSALCDIRYDSEIEDKSTASKESIQQFMDAYMAMLPDYLSLMNDDRMWMSREGFELKTVVSEEARANIEKCMGELQAILSRKATNKEKPVDGEGITDLELKVGARHSAATVKAVTDGLDQVKAGYDCIKSYMEGGADDTPVATDDKSAAVSSLLDDLTAEFK